jgi:MOSC domain-containing protein YiiM
VVSGATILSIQVGKPQRLGSDDSNDPLGAPWESGIFKGPVAGPLWLGPTGLAGDGQADRRAHGGPNQAVLLYGAAHYPEWREVLERPDLANGAFGENFTVEGVTEREACLGDRLAVGEAIIEISQPRQPCWKLGRRHGILHLAERVIAANRGGWYVRVLREGNVEAGQPLELLERPCPEWPIARVNDVIYKREPDPAVRAELAAIPYLSARWRQRLRKSSSA